MKYYDVRNVMISMVDTPYEVSAKQIKWNLFKRVIGAAVRYRYNDADAALQAVADLYDIGLPFTSRRLFHFDAESGKGILVERNRKEARRLWREYRSICRTIDSRHDEVVRLWREHKKVMVTKEYWEKYLGI